ncbi:hypothetical protein FRB99_001044 [Tulasnella sp. 403]|nr:hypothetical protein FRB99_001044 [Tulasnella sp. 403]
MVSFALPRVLVSVLVLATAAHAAVIGTRTQPVGRVLERAAAVSEPSEGRMTNAKRLAAGLPPLPAKKNTRGNVRPRASPVVQVIITRQMSNYGGVPAHGGPQGPATMINNGLRHNNLQVEKGGYWIGYAPEDAQILGDSSANYLTGGLHFTASPVQAPEPYTLANTVFESSIWDYDASTGQISLVWTNADITTAPCKIYFYTNDSSSTPETIFTPDLEATQAAKPGNYLEVVYSLESP